MREAAPAVNPVTMEADDGFEESATASTTTVATDAPALPDEEAEYLEDVDAGQPDAAGRFMAWLQHGLAGGTLPVNVAGALVHFVPEGMLLVSPRIFREFAMRFGEDGHGPAAAVDDPDIGKSIQRQFLRAGWHRRVEKGVNILSYQVMRGERAVSQLSGVVIPNPERFIDPVPAVNPVLLRLPAQAGEA